MKIAIFVSSLKFGGAEKQAVLDANLFAGEHEVFLYYFEDGPLKSAVSPRVRAERIEKRGYLDTASRLRKRIRANRIGIIHASLFAPCVLATLAALFTRARVIWHFHSHEYDLPLRSKLAFNWLARAPRVRKILFVNQELMAHFSSALRLPARKMAVLYNHSELNGLREKEAGNPQRPLHLGYLGRVVELKRVHYLVGLADFFVKNNFTNFRIHIVGDGEALNEVKDMARARQVQEYISFHGFQPDVAKYYRQFDIFVNPSSEECLSVAMIDAGMMALPIVAFDVGGNNEIVLNGKTGYIVNNTGDFFQKCLLLAREEGIRCSFGLAGRQHCRSLFSREKHAEKLRELYMEIADVH